LLSAKGHAGADAGSVSCPSAGARLFSWRRHSEMERGNHRRPSRNFPARATTASLTRRRHQSFIARAFALVDYGFLAGGLVLSSELAGNGLHRLRDCSPINRQSAAMADFNVDAKSPRGIELVLRHVQRATRLA